MHADPMQTLKASCAVPATLMWVCIIIIYQLCCTVLIVTVESHSPKHCDISLDNIVSETMVQFYLMHTRQVTFRSIFSDAWIM